LSFEVTGNPDLSGHGSTLAVTQDAQFLMQQALGMYARVGDLMKQAVETSGKDRQAFATQAQQLLSSASSLFDRGLQKVLNLRQAVGFKTINKTTPEQPSQPLPTISPSASPSASPSPSPSA
jgi:hypothetical protein